MAQTGVVGKDVQQEQGKRGRVVSFSGRIEIKKNHYVRALC